jgi:dCMP deaminase
MIEFKEYTPPSWDEVFMRGVYLIATKSKDKSTKFGACVVLDNSPILWGFNGIPRKVKDLTERMERPIKYKYTAHAERNACYQGTKMGISAEGATLYTQGIPCCDCSIAVIQSGIKEIVIHKQWSELEEDMLKNRDQWKGGNEISTTMFNEAGVNVRVFDGVLGLKGYLNGMIIDI